MDGGGPGRSLWMVWSDIHVERIQVGIRLEFTVQWHHCNLDDLMVTWDQSGSLSIDADEQISIKVNQRIRNHVHLPRTCHPPLGQLGAHVH